MTVDPLEHDSFNDEDDDEEERGVALKRNDGNYRLVHHDDSAVATTSTPKWQTILNTNLLSDDDYSFRGIRILDGPESVRFLKFVVLTCLGILLVHFFVAWVDWERDTEYSIQDMVVYDGNYIILDIMVFFVVGRLFCKQGVDHLGWILISMCAAVYASWETTFSFLQHSVSLYEMHCHWPLKLWVYCLVLVPLVSIVVFKHLQYAVDNQVLVVKLVEVGLTALFCMAPVASNPNFHFHHWFAGWLLGMQANYDRWWSRATMAWCWGLYMNGIAVYGRDATLTCAYSFFQSTSGNCPYMSCYKADNNSTHHGGGYKPMEVPDWRNCSGYAP